MKCLMGLVQLLIERLMLSVLLLVEGVVLFFREGLGMEGVVALRLGLVELIVQRVDDLMELGVIGVGMELGMRTDGLEMEVHMLLQRRLIELGLLLGLVLMEGVVLRRGKGLGVEGGMLGVLVLLQVRALGIELLMEGVMLGSGLLVEGVVVGV